MGGREFLDVARQLCSGPGEAYWRAAVGRAYYAVFHEALSVLQAWGFVPVPRDPVHSFVRLRFQYTQDLDLQSIGATLEKLGQLRNRADYQLGKPAPFHNDRVARQAVHDAAHAIMLLDQIEADPARRAAALQMIRAAWP